MRTRARLYRIAVSVFCLMVATAVWAGCRQDCAVDLNAALQACEVNYKRDPRNLTDCRENAQREYEACLEDCKSQDSAD